MKYWAHSCVREDLLDERAQPLSVQPRRDIPAAASLFDKAGDCRTASNGSIQVTCDGLSADQVEILAPDGPVTAAREGDPLTGTQWSELLGTDTQQFPKRPWVTPEADPVGLVGDA